MTFKPTLEGYFIETADKGNKAREIRTRRYNYSTVYGNLDQGVLPFSFFGTPGDSLDIFGRALNIGYGRIDAEMDAVMPRRDALGPIGISSSQFVLTFVAHAFRELQQNLASEAHGGHALKLRGGPYAGLKPVRGWENIDTLHSTMLENLYAGFLMPYLRGNQRQDKVLSFDDFIKMFLRDFLNDVMLPRALRLTRSGFSLSNKSTPMGSGLVIDLSSDDHNDDGEKYHKWLSHPSYGVVRDAAANFGFAIDKHAPWRLVANLQSPKMLPYIQGRGLLQDKTKATRLISGKPIEASQVFGVFYEKTYKKDIDILKRTVYNFYEKYVSDRPYVSTAKATQCSTDSSNGRNPSSITKMRFRKKLTFEEMEKKYDDYFWLNQYLLIRLAEAQVDVSQDRIERELRKISYINKYLGHDKALTYINEYANMVAPPLAKSLFAGATTGQTLQITGQAATITTPPPAPAATPASAPSGGGTTGY